MAERSIMNTVLLLTVGGSHQPIVTAIRELAPDYVVFFCTGRDPVTGRPGSEAQVLGQGTCIKASVSDERPSLPNIPTQAGLTAEQYQLVQVPADDLDGAVFAMHAAFEEVAAKFPGARRVADYTGGTKTMTAALVAAALEAEGVELQIVTGARADLVKVQDGTQSSAPAAVERLRLTRAMRPFLEAWARFAYDEASEGLKAIRTPRDPALRPKLVRAREFSAAFAAWDRFDHASAQRLLEPFGAIVGQSLGVHLGALKILSGPESPRREALRIWDLWLNAERRARGGRYDDAVARAYRMIEWAAQWILKTRAGLDTADLPAGKAAGFVQPNRDGKYQAGLFAAWQLVQAHTGGAGARFFADHRLALLDHLQARNVSILAHGFTAIGHEQWQRMHAWLEEAFIPVLREEMKAAGQKEVFPQLPDAYLWKV